MSENQTSTDITTRLVVGHKRDGRCVYSREAKHALVEACRQPGASVARIALNHGVNANLLRRWMVLEDPRKMPRRSRAQPSVPVLLPVSALPPNASAAAPPKCESPPESDIEIVLSAATIRLRGAVDARQLRTVLDCLARS